MVITWLKLQDLSGKLEISWNHTEFEVRYECLSEEIKIGTAHVHFEYHSAKKALSCIWLAEELNLHLLVKTESSPIIYVTICFRDYNFFALFAPSHLIH